MKWEKENSSYETDQDDLNLYQEAYKAYQEDLKTLSHAEFKKELGL